MNNKQNSGEQVNIGFVGISPPPYVAEDPKMHHQTMGEEQITDSTETSKLYQDKMSNIQLIQQEQSNSEIYNKTTVSGSLAPNELNELELAFSEMSIRRAFARKVFVILSLLLLKTVAYSAICTYCQPVRKFWVDNILYILIGMPTYLTAALLLICVETVRRTVPWNYAILLTMSSSITFMVGGICALYKEETVMIAFGMTTVLVVGLAIFACQTRWDFTAIGMGVFALALILSLTTVMSLSLLSIGGRVALGGLAVFILSIFLIIDIQLIIVGSHSYKISPEDHILAVAVLYLDIINLFLTILRYMKQ